MHLFSEHKLLYAIGLFSPTVSLYPQLGFDYVQKPKRTTSDFMSSNVMPGQVQAFLNTTEEFVWYIEEHTLTPSNSTVPNVPKMEFTSKTVYPAKVTGLGLPLLSHLTTPVTLRWREGLIRWGNQENYPTLNYDSQSGNFRPGFGEIIPADLQRPFRTVTVPINNIGLTINSGNQSYFSGFGGRLFAMAFSVNKEELAKYNASKKKRKSPNSQDYEQVPTYPPYTPYSGGGYYG
jgi:hypothetical protein